MSPSARGWLEWERRNVKCVELGWVGRAVGTTVMHAYSPWLEWACGGGEVECVWAL